MKKRLVIVTGAGMSAESGIATFRDADGLWEGHDVMEVASPQGWRKDQEMVLKFYNERRKNLLSVEPNSGHKNLADLEEDFDVQIITQNVDDLHERGGSKNVLHLHGELRKVRSTKHPELIYNWDKDLNTGDNCEKGAQLRPHIVWFGEEVPAIEEALNICIQADILVVIGTSLLVYPAAGLLNYAEEGVPKFIIDPNIPEGIPNDFVKLAHGASEGTRILKEQLAFLK